MAVHRHIKTTTETSKMEGKMQHDAACAYAFKSLDALLQGVPNLFFHPSAIMFGKGSCDPKQHSR